MKNRYKFLITFCLMLFITIFKCSNAYAATTDFTSYGTLNNYSNIVLIDMRYFNLDINGEVKGSTEQQYYVFSNTPIKVREDLNSATSMGYGVYSSSPHGYLSATIATNVPWRVESWNDNVKSYTDGVMTSKDSMKGTPVCGIYSIKGENFNIDGTTQLGTPPAEVSDDFDTSDITKYPVGTVKIVQPKSGAKFSNGVSTTIDVEVWGKIPISIDDGTWWGLGEETWLKNALSAPITQNSSIYIDGVKDRFGTGIGINSASLGDSYGLEILGDLDDWKQLGYYCFKYKFTYSPLDKDSIQEITYGVSPVTSWKTNVMIDDYGYTYYSDTIDLKIGNYIDYNNDGVDDVTGEDLSNLNDNSSSVPLDPNASIADTLEYYTNKFYDGITGAIKTPFNMLESALKLGDTYLVKLTDLLMPVSNNFKQLLSFVPDDIMTCIWGIIVCRLTWTTIRSFISMLTKR